MANYRPISNLNFIGKILEKIVLEQLNDNLSTEPTFNCYQSTHKTHHSTETALTKITSDICTAMDKKKITALMLLDFSATFDTISHNILIDHLRCYFNISSTTLGWFASYLADRHQSVHVGEASSIVAAITHGEPQNSICSPVIFTMYTAPLSDLIESHDLQGHYYADNSQ